MVCRDGVVHSLNLHSSQSTTSSLWSDVVICGLSTSPRSCRLICRLELVLSLGMMQAGRVGSADAEPTRCSCTCVTDIVLFCCFPTFPKFGLLQESHCKSPHRYCTPSVRWLVQRVCSGNSPASLEPHFNCNHYVSRISEVTALRGCQITLAN
jgi:hypothetical protein